MNFQRVAIVLAFAGIAFAVAAFSISFQNFGSCPAGWPSCDHVFPGTNIWIGQTASEVGIVAIALLVSSIGVSLYGTLTRPH